MITFLIQCLRYGVGEELTKAKLRLLDLFKEKLGYIQFIQWLDMDAPFTHFRGRHKLQPRSNLWRIALING